MNKIFPAAVSAICLVVASTGARADIITNGSFESPVISTSFYENYGANTGNANYGGASISGWVIPTDVNSTNNVDIVSNLTGWPAPTADGGHQYLDLVGYGGAGEIYQLLNTVSGQTYQLSFSYSNNPGISPAAAVVTVTGSPGVSSLLSHQLSTTDNLGWTTFTATFVANSTSTKLDFLETIGGNNAGVLLDAVNVTPVPEPSTWAMMIMGFAGIGLLFRRRRRTFLHSFT